MENKIIIILSGDDIVKVYSPLEIEEAIVIETDPDSIDMSKYDDISQIPMCNGKIVYAVNNVSIKFVDADIQQTILQYELDI